MCLGEWSVLHGDEIMNGMYIETRKQSMILHRRDLLLSATSTVLWHGFLQCLDVTACAQTSGPMKELTVTRLRVIVALSDRSRETTTTLRCLLLRFMSEEQEVLIDIAIQSLTISMLFIQSWTLR